MKKASVRPSTQANLAILCSKAAILAGVVTAIFWLTTVPFDTFAGREVATHPLFVPGQILHLLGAALTALGVVGIFLTSGRHGTVANSAFLLCFFGALAFLADAAIALVAFPPIANGAPELISSDGLLFTGWAFGFFVGFAVVQMFGYVAFGLVCWASNLFPKAGCVLLMLGAVLANLPPMPGMHLLMVLGGLIWSAGIIILGFRALSLARTSQYEVGENSELD